MITIQTIKSIEEIPKLVNDINSNDESLIIGSLISLRRFIANLLIGETRITTTQAIINSGVVPRLVKLLSLNEFISPIKNEAAWLISSITTGSTQQTQIVVNNGAIDIFLSILKNSKEEDLKALSLWALSNISSDSDVFRDLILDKGGLSIIINIVSACLLYSSQEFIYNEINLSIFRIATSILSNLCTGIPPPPFEIIKSSIPILSQLLHFQDTRILIDAVTAISTITDNIDLIINGGICPRLIELLEYPDIKVQSSSLRTISNLLSGTQQQIQILLNLSIIKYLLYFIKSSDINLRRYSCWSFSSITRGNIHQIQEMININLMDYLIEVLKNQNEESHMKRTVCLIISNTILNGTFEQFHSFINENNIKPFFGLLDDNIDGLINDNLYLDSLLNQIELILIVGKHEQDETGGDFNTSNKMIKDIDGYIKINQFKNHTNPDIRQRVIRILEHDE